MRLVGNLALSTTHFFRGDLAAALAHTDVGDPSDDPSAFAHSAFAYGQDQKVVALAQKAILYWHLGHVDQALEISEQSIERGRQLGHPMSLAFAMAYADWLRILRREPQECRVQAEAVLSYAAIQGLPHWIPGALHSRGWALAEEGDLAGGIASMEEGLMRMAAFGAHLGRGPRLTDLAAAQRRSGNLAAARASMDQAKPMVVMTAERYSESEMFRVEAELLLAEAEAAGDAGNDARARAEELLEAGAVWANRQGSRTLELRALMALARLRRRGAKAQQARARVGECFASFSEGFDTADLREARMLKD
jgi:adenylate cyclase